MAEYGKTESGGGFLLCYNVEMRRYILLALLGLAFADWIAWSYVLEGNSLRVTFFDVGQGDAIL